MNKSDPLGLTECFTIFVESPIGEVRNLATNEVSTASGGGYYRTICIGGIGGGTRRDGYPTVGPRGFGGGGGGSVGVSGRSDTQQLQAGACSAKQINFAVTAVSDATLILGGAGVVVRGLAGAARATRAAGLIASTPRLARTNRLVGAFADRKAAFWSIGHGLGQLAGGYFTPEAVHMALAQVPDVSWADFVPGFAIGKAWVEMASACGY